MKMSNLPSPPFIDVPGISNFRDIGGQPTSDDRQVRRGLVFRSADPSRATEDGLKKMSELGKVRLANQIALKQLSNLSHM